MCSDPLDPGGDVRDCSVGCTLGMSDISPFRAAAALNVHREFPELKKCIFKRVCSGYGRISGFAFVVFYSNAHGPAASMMRPP